MVKFFFIIFITLFTLILPGGVSASSEKIDSYNVVITARKDGSMDIFEKIVYDFGDNSRRGIFRDIPTQTPVGDLKRIMQVQVLDIKRDGVSEKYQVRETDGNINIRIGDPNVYIRGLHTYEISYRVLNGIGSNFETHDEIYWNIVGNGWDVPVLNSSAVVRTDFNVSPTKIACFTGSFGSRESYCTYPNSLPFMPVTLTQPLSPNQGFSVVVGYPAGTFPKSVLTYPDTDSQNSDRGIFIFFLNLAIGWVVLNLIITPLFLIWYLLKKSKSRFGSVSVNFDIPTYKHKRVNPAEAGVLDLGYLDREDVIAALFDLAIRKFIKIEQTKDGSADTKLIKLKSFNSSELDEFERKLLEGVFKGKEEVHLSKVKDFYETYSELEDLAIDNLIKKGLYQKDPRVQNRLLTTLGIFSILTTNFVFGVVIIWFSKILKGRTPQGDELDWRIDGLKLFLKNMKRHYNFHTQKLIIVERYIPYAIALGFIDEFMEQLKIIQPEYVPDWYSGDVTFYDSYDNVFSNFGSAIQSSSLSSGTSSRTTRTTSSSFSGFSGGGFSSGGGGGGGGGSW